MASADADQQQSPINHVIIYSGGADSYTLLHYVLKHYVRVGDGVHALSFHYGQRHNRELASAKAVCQELNLAHDVIDLRQITPFLGGSALTNPAIPVPHGHYAAESMKQTVVPGRNTMMLALGLAFAEGWNAARNATIYYGAHAGDHAIYPDCRPEYISAMARTIKLASDGHVELVVPFWGHDKAWIVAQGLRELGLDYRKTWTCYEGGEQACGKCGSCVERLLAFDTNNAVDPLPYADKESYKMQK